MDANRVVPSTSRGLKILGESSEGQHSDVLVGLRSILLPVQQPSPEALAASSFVLWVGCGPAVSSCHSKKYALFSINPT